jgi:hypothetical protein
MKSFIAFACLFSSILSAQTGTVTTVPNSEAACGTVLIDGKPHYICDWEPHLRQAAAGVRSDGAWSTSVGSAGGYCLQSGGNDGFRICGGSVSASLGGGGGWDALSRGAGMAVIYAPAIINSFSDNAYLRDKAQSFFNSSNAGFDSQLAATQNLVANFKAAQQAFAAQVVPPSIELFKEKSLGGLSKGIDEKLTNIFAVKEDVAGPAADFGPPPMLGVSAPVQHMSAGLKSAVDLRRKWDAVEPVWQAVVRGADKDLSAVDAKVLTDTYDAYFTNQGLLRENTLGAELGAASRSIGDSLHTSLGTASGRQVRLQVNRNLVAAASAVDDDGRARAWGGVALAVGADEAFTAGKKQTAEQLINTSAAVADSILGFIPIAGAVNDAGQILCGLATGHDYTGRAMTAGDYGWRGVGVVLGLLPAKAILKVGGKILDRTFVLGGGVIRRLGLGSRFGKILAQEPGAVTDITTVAAQWTKRSEEIAEELAARKSLGTVADILESSPGLQTKVAAELAEISSKSGITFNKDTFVEHFYKHVLNPPVGNPSLGVKTPKEVFEKAVELATSKTGVESFVRASDGSTLMFRKQTGEFLVMKDGIIATYFKPRTGEAYWVNQLKSIVK